MKKPFKLHGSSWMGLVGKGKPGEEPCTVLPDMLNLFQGAGYDGADLFLADPHVPASLDEDGLRVIADDMTARGLGIGSLVANVWCGDAVSEEGSAKFLDEIRRACAVAKVFNQHGARKFGVIRIDTNYNPTDWAKNPAAAHKAILKTFKEAGKIAAGEGEKLAMEPEVCWGGIHSRKTALRVLEAVDMRGVVGCQADMAHLYLFLLGVNDLSSALLKEGYSQAEFDAAYAQLVSEFGPWTIDFHVAGNDGTVHGTGSHDKTGRHCRVDDPNLKFDIAQCAALWVPHLYNNGVEHITYDGCMFDNDIIRNPDTHAKIVSVMRGIRDAAAA